MPDMLVALYRLPDPAAEVARLREAGVIVRRANPWELSAVREFVGKEFAGTWADEVQAGFARQPVSVYLAIREGEIIGFAAYECTRRDYFGPMGVVERERGQGIARVLLLQSLRGLWEMGYAYAIIGGVGPAEFYAKACGAVMIEGSTPGIYGEGLKKK